MNVRFAGHYRNWFRKPVWSLGRTDPAEFPRSRGNYAWATAGLRRAFLVDPFRPANVVPGLKTRRLDRLSAWALVASSLAIQDAGIDLSQVDRSQSCRGLRHRLRLC